jgi:6-hydroxynicotinate 3-monooxygenase
VTTYKPRIAIVGAGMGGLATAAALQRFGFPVQIYEQAERFSRVGAGIQMSPNAMHALRGLGLEARIRRDAYQPQTWNNREWDSGNVKFELVLGAVAEAEFGAPYLQMHRGDLHEALLSAVPDSTINLARRLIDVTPSSNGLTLTFADRSRAEADLIVGADGVHSRVRGLLLGPDRPVDSGRVAYRATFDTSLLRRPVGGYTKWWGEDRHIVIYYVTAARDEIYFVTSLADTTGARESWSAIGDMAVVRDAFAGFHDEVSEVLRACPLVHRWAILERGPPSAWHGGGIVLLGDAAHPMTPYMAQGAAMAIEDGIILARALDLEAELERALAIYQAKRTARTAQVQAVSSANIWMSENTDPSWCYSYDPWSESLGH